MFSIVYFDYDMELNYVIDSKNKEDLIEWLWILVKPLGINQIDAMSREVWAFGQIARLCVLKRVEEHV